MPVKAPVKKTVKKAPVKKTATKKAKSSTSLTSKGIEMLEAQKRAILSHYGPKDKISKENEALIKEIDAKLK